MAEWQRGSEEGHKIPQERLPDDQVVLSLRQLFISYALSYRTPKPHDKQSLTTLKPKLKAFMDKYASTTIDPVELIKKYHRSKKRANASAAKRKFAPKFQEAGEEEKANRKYPTKFLHSEKAETTTKAATNDAFPRYTTSASFRRKPSDDKSQSSVSTKRYGHKLAVTERAGEGGDSWWADLQRRNRWERLEERRREEEVKREKESRREERRKEERRQEEWRREEEKRRKEEEREADERRQDEMWAEQQRRDQAARRAAEARVELEAQRNLEDTVRRRGGDPGGLAIFCPLP